MPHKRFVARIELDSWNLSRGSLKINSPTPVPSPFSMDHLNYCSVTRSGQVSYKSKSSQPDGWLRGGGAQTVIGSR